MSETEDTALARAGGLALALHPVEKKQQNHA
jgi:hypothetical protein